MKKLLWIGNPFFRAELPDFGWEVTAYAPAEGEVLTLADCLRLCPEPDLLVVSDMSRPPFVLGMEDCPCPTLYYCIDTHIHSWMPWYGQAFDACLISLKDHIALFGGKRLPQERLHWMPPYAPPLPPGLEFGSRDMDLVFIGRINANTPIRAAFLDELKKDFPDMIAQFGDFNKFFPRAKIVVNSCEEGDLNFRVFEALGLGAALITPDVGNGQAELFESGRHLLTYELGFGDDKEGNGRRAAAQAAPLIRDLLEKPEKRDALGRAGFAEVDARHRAVNRAERFTQLAEGLTPEIAATRRASAEMIREAFLKLVYLHWAESLPEGKARLEYLKAATRRMAGRMER